MSSFNQIDDVTLRTAYAFDKVMLISDMLGALTLEKLKDLKGQDLTKDEFSRMIKEVGKLLFFWMTQVFMGNVFDTQSGKEKGVIILTKLFEKNSLTTQDLEEYFEAYKNRQEVKIFGKNTVAIVGFYGAVEIAELNTVSFGFYEDVLREIKNAFTLDKSELIKGLKKEL